MSQPTPLSIAQALAAADERFWANEEGMPALLREDWWDNNHSEQDKRRWLALADAMIALAGEGQEADGHE